MGASTHDGKSLVWSTVLYLIIKQNIIKRDLLCARTFRDKKIRIIEYNYMQGTIKELPNQEHSKWGRASNAVIQAQNVLMRKLGITVPNEPRSADSIAAYQATFKTPLSEAHKTAMRALFPRGGPTVPATASSGIDP